MGIVRNVSRNLYRTFVPEFVRRSEGVARLRALIGGHDSVYSSEFFEKDVEGPAVRSAGRIAQSIVTEFAGRRVVDVGCGTGALLAALRERGCEVFGLEYAEAALKFCRGRQLEVAKFDLERGAYNESRTFDVTSSMEVAEHLPESVADRYVDLLTRLSPVVVFTAATPGQGGTDHINEQPHQYWIDKFRRRGFDYLEEASIRWREAWEASGEVQDWYYRNLMIFRRPG